MTVSELYRKLDERIPPSLSCEWDNDGVMCLPEPDRTVKRILVSLDITEAVVDRAIEGGYDAIVSHHPLLFHAVKHMTATDPVSRNAIKLCRAGVAAFSFHTRLDALAGGVNDVLADLLTVKDALPFGDEGIGRVGELAEEMSPEAFAALVAERLHAPAVTLADADKPIRRVAVLGGAGGDDLFAAFAAGADAYVTGEASHHHLLDAPAMGMTLIVAGHHHTEQPVCAMLGAMLQELLPEAHLDVIDHYQIRTIVR